MQQNRKFRWAAEHELPFVVERLIEVLQVKYLNNIIEQDHRFIKKLTKQMKGFKSFNSASATLEGIEVAHMIHKRQFKATGQSAFQQFAALAG